MPVRAALTPRPSRPNSPTPYRSTLDAPSWQRAECWSSTVFDPAYEALVGSHRVQRVPNNEKRGRRHSSLVTVVALDGRATSRAVVNPADVRTDTYRDSGPGGQHRNTTDSAVRLTHLPTGVVVTATEDRSQHVNRQRAWQRLEAALVARSAADTHAEQNAVRQAAHGEYRSWTWCAWRDEVTGPPGRTSMRRALAGRLDPLLGASKPA